MQSEAMLRSGVEGSASEKQRGSVV